MLTSVQSILFATDLSEKCQPALEYTIVMATCMQATIYMLHVIEELPENTDSKLMDLLGRHQWEDLLQSAESNVKKSLLGKQSTNEAIRAAVRDFCSKTGIAEETTHFKSREIIISNGDIAEQIIAQATKNNCDLIILGGHRSLFGKTAVGATIKTVLKNAQVPVTIVPSAGNW